MTTYEGAKAALCFLRFVKLAKAVGVDEVTELLAKYAEIDAEALKRLLKTAKLRKDAAKDVEALLRILRHTAVYVYCSPETFAELAAQSPADAIRRCIYVPGTTADSLAKLWNSGMFWEYICERIAKANAMSEHYSRRTRNMLHAWASYCQSARAGLPK